MTQPWDIYEISQKNPYLSQGSGFQMRSRYNRDDASTDDDDSQSSPPDKFRVRVTGKAARAGGGGPGSVSNHVALAAQPARGPRLS